MPYKQLEMFPSPHVDSGRLADWKGFDMGLIINDDDTCQCGAYWQDNGYCSAGHPKPDWEERYSFTVIPNDEDPEMGGYFAFKTGLPDWVRGYGDTPLDAIVCLCACIGEQQEEEWMYKHTRGYVTPLSG